MNTDKRRNIFSLQIVLAGLIFLTPVSVRADCANPPGAEADQFYNSAHKTMQFCDGTDWWSMKGGAADLPDCAVGDGIVMTSAGYWDCSPGGPP